MDLASVMSELYGLPPRQFTEVRDARASEARAAGDRDLASSVKKLRKPSAGAWMANMLARQQKADVDRLIGLGEELRASRNPSGEQIRNASKEKADAVRALLRQAARIASRAGEPLSQAAQQDVEATLDAAFADHDSAAALREGCLTGPLSYSGLGFGSEPRDTPSRVSARARASKSPPPTTPAVAKARRGLQEATEEAEQADADLKTAKRAVVDAEADLKRLHATLAVSERRAVQARQKMAAAQKRLDTVTRPAKP
ncbi:MAG TPA: hypothetical protein VGF51_07470 [Acidimicrobiales bacterium]